MGETRVITKEFKPSVALSYRASREIFHLTSASRFFYGIYGGCAFILLMPNLMQGQEFADPSTFSSIPAWVVVAGILVYVFLLAPLLQYRTIAMNWKNNPSASARLQYEIS